MTLSDKTLNSNHILKLYGFLMTLKKLCTDKIIFLMTKIHFKSKSSITQLKKTQNIELSFLSTLSRQNIDSETQICERYQK